MSKKECEECGEEFPEELMRSNPAETRVLSDYCPGCFIDAAECLIEELTEEIAEARKQLDKIRKGKSCRK